MKEHPILFSAPMVRAILDGRKTQTRRIVKKLPWYDPASNRWIVRGKGRIGLQFNTERDAFGVMPILCPYGTPGDRLWVRETWRTDESLNDKAPRAFSGWPVRYEADGAVLRHGACFGNANGKTRVSIHMPSWASRILLEITAVRVERLNDISEQDAWSEGCEGFDDDVTGGKSGYSEYAELWDEINGPGSWAANPWVWVVEFSRIDMSESRGVN